MAICDLEASSLEQLVSSVLDISNQVTNGAFLWFRGIGCDHFNLLPKIMRDGKTSEEVFARESRLITRFRQRSLPFWPAGYPQDDWEQLFAMQHFGIPTRLLDWSENVFVAVHFALNFPADGHGDHLCTPTIYCLDPVGWNRGTPVLSEFGDDVYVLTTADDESIPYRPVTQRKRNSTPIAIFGAHNSNRIVAQRGTFLVWGKDTRPLEEFVKPDDTTVIWRISLKAARAQMQENLRFLGFSETMVFPELQSLADELTRVEGWR